MRSHVRHAIAALVCASAAVACQGESAQCPAAETTAGGEDAKPAAPNARVVAATDDGALEHEIRELLALTNAAAMAQQIVAPMFSTLSSAYPNVPAQVWRELFAAIDTVEFTGLLVAVYKRIYTREEIAGMLEFYRSDVGQRILQKMPLAVSAGQEAGAAWGQSLAEQLMSKARERGYEL